MNWPSAIRLPYIHGLVEIVCLAVLFYSVLLFFRGTRAASTLAGFSLVFVVMIVVTRIFHLDALHWMLQRFSVYLAVAILIIFQPEIRRALAELGKRYLPGGGSSDINLADHVLKAASLLSKRKIGALIAIERDIGTRAIQETGVKINSAVTPELLASIFFPYTPLHDGGVIIREDMIVAARCIFPLSQRVEFSGSLGTRHRAALGLTEETDALVVVISEETGKVSCAHKGRLFHDMDEEKLRRFLSNVLLKNRPEADIQSRLRKFWTFFRAQAAGVKPAAH